MIIIQKRRNRKQAEKKIIGEVLKGCSNIFTNDPTDMELKYGVMRIVFPGLDFYNEIQSRSFEKMSEHGESGMSRRSNDDKSLYF